MALAARCCYIFAMSWTSTTQAKLGMGAFSREWIRPVPAPPILPPPTTSPPLAVSAPAHDDKRARYRVMTFTTFFGTRGYPQARIDHGKAGDDHLTRYYKKNGTYSGATVYIKSAADTNPVASSQSSASTQAEDTNPVASAQLSVVDEDWHSEGDHLGGQGGEDLLSGRGVKRSRPWC